jgi:hypothetical protein
MRTRKYGGDREKILEPEKYFNDPKTGALYHPQVIADAVRDATNTTSSFERYLVNSIGMYNGKEGVKTFKYCNTTSSTVDPECLQRGARMKIAFQKFADMPPQAYFQFGATSVLNQGVNATKNAWKDTTTTATAISNDPRKYFFGPKKAGTRKRR